MHAAGGGRGAVAPRGLVLLASGDVAQTAGGGVKALSRPRGRKPVDGRDAQIVALARRAERAEAELRKARKVIEVQGNVSALLGQLLEPRGATEPGSTGR